MSVQSPAAKGEVPIREAPSISEHQDDLGRQIEEMRRRINAFIADFNKMEVENLKNDFFALQRILWDVLNSTDEGSELYLLTDQILNHLDVLAQRQQHETEKSDQSSSKSEKDSVNLGRILRRQSKIDEDFVVGAGRDGIKDTLKQISKKLAALAKLLRISSAEASDSAGKGASDPVILVTAPSLDSQEENGKKLDADLDDVFHPEKIRLPFPGSGGKIFQPSELPSPLDRVCMSFETATSSSAPKPTMTTSEPFSPSLTTNFPFPPGKTVPISIATLAFPGDSEEGDAVPTLDPIELSRPPQKATKVDSALEDDAKEQTEQDQHGDEDELSSKMSNSSVSLDSVSSASQSLDEGPNAPFDDAQGQEEPEGEQQQDRELSLPQLNLQTPEIQAPQDLLAISPLPSPNSRHGSIFAAASSLPVPSEFAGGSSSSGSDQAIATADNTNQKIRSNDEDEDDEFEAKSLTSAQVKSERAKRPSPDSLLLAPPHYGTGDGISPEGLLPSPGPGRSRSRLSSRLSSVPEGEALKDSVEEPSSTSVDCEYDLKLENTRRPSGSRRLSVGAMISLSTLRSESGSRLSSKTIPIINPLVKNPNWPNLDRNSSRGLISMVVLASADALCAPVTPIMDWTPPPDKMEEISVMNNYFGIGIDAKISLDFHQKREESSKQRSRAKNYMWYGVLGSRELVQKTYKNLEKRVILECDGEAIPLPSLQGIVVLNIQSFMGGTNFWGSNVKDDNVFLPPMFDDGILEVVAVFGSIHMGASRIMNLQRHRIAQCRSVVIRILGQEGVPVQVDGEAWVHPPGIIRILHKNRVQIICRDRSMEQQVRSGSNSRAWYREHAHAVLLPLDDEETHLLRSLVGASRQLLHYLLLLHHALDGQEGRDLASLATLLQESMVTIPPDLLFTFPAAEARRRAAIFVNHLRNCIASCKKTLVENIQEAQSEVAGKLSQSIYWVESILRKCHEEGDLLFFTIRSSDNPQESGRRSSWFRSLPLFGRGSQSGLGAGGGAQGPPGITSSAAATAAATAMAKKKSSCLVEVVMQWSPFEVTQWLESIGLPMYCHAFKEHEISGSELLALERRDFKDVGVTKVGHIKRLQKSIKDIQNGKLPSRLLQSTSATHGSVPTSAGSLSSTGGGPATTTGSSTTTSALARASFSTTEPLSEVVKKFHQFPDLE